MTVYVVVSGCYSSQCVVGVYSSPGAAMAANPVTRPAKPKSTSERPGGWVEKDGWWTNGLDWDEAMDITPFDLDGNVPPRWEDLRVELSADGNRYVQVYATTPVQATEEE